MATKTRAGGKSVVTRRRAELARIARRRGNAPGLLTYAGAEPVGWISLGPRFDFARIDASRATPRADDVEAWVIPCITVRRAHRGRGVAVGDDPRHPAASAQGVDATRHYACAMSSVPDIAQAARGLADGTLTSGALVEVALGRYAKTEPRIHAFTWLDPERARRLARESDARRSRGSERSAIDGVPIGVKDIFDTAGIPTENGSRLFAGRVPTRSSAVVSALEDAGAIVLGKTVTTELAFRTPGPTRNPWNTAHTSGGSSMGSAAALAAGVICGAIGSQTNGSVIRPAAYCGVVGFKPTVFRLSKDGMFEFSRTLDHVGVFAGSVEGAAMLAATIARHPVARWWSPTERPPHLAALLTGEWEHASEAMRARFQADVDLLATAGGPVEWPQPPKGLDDAPRVLRTVMLYEAAQALMPTIERGTTGLVSAEARELIGEGARIDEHAYREAIAERLEIAAAFNDWAARYDAVLTPPTTGEAPGLETTGDPRFCTRWSLVGAPAVTIPTGMGPERLPLGLQLVGAQDDDARVLAAAAWAEAHLTAPGSPP